MNAPVVAGAVRASHNEMMRELEEIKNKLVMIEECLQDLVNFMQPEGDSESEESMDMSDMSDTESVASSSSAPCRLTDARDGTLKQFWRSYRYEQAIAMYT